MPIWVHDFADHQLQELHQELDQVWSRLSYQQHTQHNVLTTLCSDVVNDIANNDLRFFAGNLWPQMSAFFLAVECPETSLEIRESWFNKTPLGGFMYDHERPSAVISGIYFHCAEEDQGGSLCFRNPNPLMMNALWPADQIEHYKTHQITAKTGRLVLFPGWLTHKIMPVTGQQQHISLNFNLAAPIKLAELGPHYSAP